MAIFDNMSFLLDLLFPRRCYSCHRSGRYLCLDCQSKLMVRSIKYFSPPLGQRRGLRGGFEGRLSLFRYHHPIKDMIHDLKFEFVSDLVPELALLMSRTLKSKFPKILKYWQQENFILLPIPLHPHRQNWRGFNQTELLAKTLAPLIDLNYQNLLTRTVDTKPQTQIKDKKLRHTNLSSAFCFAPPLVKGGDGGRFILFDDVYTTGSTIKSAISCLPSNSQVWILTLA